MTVTIRRKGKPWSFVANIHDVAELKEDAVPCFHLYNAEGRYLAGFNATGLEHNFQRVAEPSEELSLPIIPIHEEAQETIA